MKGIYLHPLRLRALDRMTVLRVPVTNLGNVVLEERATPADWNAGRAHPNMRRFEDWKDKDSGALFWTDTGSVVFVPAPYAPGDYFVRETWRADWCSGSKERGYLVGIEYKSTWNGHRDPQGKTATLQKMHYCGNLTKNGTVCWKSPVTMPEWAARHYLTLGPPVPCRLGEVDVVQQRDEGVIIEIGDEYRRTWDALYPKHPFSPDRWTWGYPCEVRR